MNTFLKMVKRCKQADSELALIEEAEDTGLASTGDCIDSIISMQKEVLKDLELIRNATFMKEKEGEATNYE